MINIDFGLKNQLTCITSLKVEVCEEVLLLDSSLTSDLLRVKVS